MQGERTTSRRQVHVLCPKKHISFCLLSVLVSWARWVNPILFHMLAFASSVVCGLLKSSIALSALRCRLNLLLISGSFLLCVYQENPVPEFLQTETHRLSWRMRPVGCWLLPISACTPATWTSDPRKSRRREVLVFLGMTVLRDTLIPFPGSK